MNGALGAICCALYCAVAVLLVRKYRVTRDAGLLWLGLPLVVLPVVALPLALWLEAGVDGLVSGQPVGRYPFILVEQGRLALGAFLTRLNLVQHVVWGLTALLAALTLYRVRR